MRTLTTLAAIGAALTLTLAACGDDYDQDQVDALKAQGASQKQAECLIDELGDDTDKIFEEDAPDNATEILAAIERCGVDEDEGGDTEDTGDEPTDSGEEGEESAAIGIDELAGCLEGAGFTVATDDGPPARVDIIGETGTGAAYYYDTADQAANAAQQFEETFTTAAEFSSGSLDSIGWYYNNSADEASQMEGCLPS
jgi:hypothetical protein